MKAKKTGPVDQSSVEQFAKTWCDNLAGRYGLKGRISQFDKTLLRDMRQQAIMRYLEGGEQALSALERTVYVTLQCRRMAVFLGCVARVEENVEAACYRGQRA